MKVTKKVINEKASSNLDSAFKERIKVLTKDNPKQTEHYDRLNKSIVIFQSTEKKC